jgi:predicted ester cyclase
MTALNANRVFLMLLLASLWACQPQPAVDTNAETAAANREFVNDYFDALNSDNWQEAIVPFFTEGEADEFIATHEAFRNAFGDYHMTVDKVVSEGAMVAMWGTVSATHVGEFPYGEFKGAAPSGKTATWTEAMLFEVKDGTFGEWGGFVLDGISRMQQLDIQCLPAAEADADADAEAE